VKTTHFPRSRCRQGRDRIPMLRGILHEAILSYRRSVSRMIVITRAAAAAVAAAARGQTFNWKTIRAEAGFMTRTLALISRVVTCRNRYCLVSLSSRRNDRELITRLNH